MLRGRFSNMIATANSFSYSDTKKMSERQQANKSARSLSHSQRLHLPFLQRRRHAILLHSNTII